MKFDYNTSYHDSFKLLRHTDQRIAYGLLLVVLIALPWMASKFLIGELSYVFILCIASLGLMVLTGYTGQVSLGHAAFVAVGAYAHAWMLSKGVPLLISLPISGLLCAAFGVALGVPAIRVSGLYLAMVTLAFSVIVTHVIGHWGSVTGGFTGLAVNDPSVFGASLAGPKAFYFLCLTLLVLVLLGLLNLLRSGLGRAFFYAGTRALLVTNWSVHSQSAKDLVTDLFKRQADDRKLARGEALRQAMMAMVDGRGYTDASGKTEFAYAHPLFWAPYTIIGDGGKR